MPITTREITSTLTSGAAALPTAPTMKTPAASRIISRRP
jgi:hypothetical protein